MKSFSLSLDFPHKHRLITSKRIKIPKEIEVPIFLIRHELQTRMFYKHLSDVGLTWCYFENFLDRLILASLGMWDATDATFKIYFDLMEKWSENINADDDVITRRALKIYHALIKAKRKKAGLRLRHQTRRKIIRKEVRAEKMNSLIPNTKLKMAMKAHAGYK